MRVFVNQAKLAYNKMHTNNCAAHLQKRGEERMERKERQKGKKKKEGGQKKERKDGQKSKWT